jgi:hypothetical protein
MSSNAAIVVAIFILMTTAFALLVLTASRKRAAKEEELKRAASTRGWQFESTTERGYRLHRWSGTTEGVPWRAESLHYPSGNRRRRRPNIARWHADWSPGITAPVLCMAVPKGKELHSTAMTPNDSFLGKMAQKAVGFAFDKAVDVYFGVELGKQVDAGAMHSVETKLPGFIVMAANKDDAARLLTQGLEQSLTAATHDPNSIFSNETRPWILFRPNGLSLARTEQFRDTNEMDGFIRAGVALTRSSRFARPFA